MGPDQDLGPVPALARGQDPAQEQGQDPGPGWAQERDRGMGQAPDPAQNCWKTAHCTRY
ncbi:hypothetical protein [Ferrimonas balearica]|uniref:hypothetical protein n=1 Tax=Ferrimonas balearica TaxID=44012 RepID=UPI001FEE5FDF|nr:hypothetical protein [Ferrimonas balearica]